MPRFDYTAAKKAGYSDDQIAQYLSQQKASGNDLYIDKNEFAGHQAPPAPPAQPRGYKPSFLENLANNTIGGGTFAAGLGNLLAGHSKAAKASEASQETLRQSNQQLLQRANQYPVSDPRRQQLAQTAGNNYRMLSADAQQQLDALPSKKQFLASAGQLALTATGAKIPSGGMVQKLAPGTSGGALNLAARIATSKPAITGAQSALSGAIGAYGNTKGEGLGITQGDVGSIAAQAGVSGLSGAATQAGLQLLGTLFRNATAKTGLPKFLYEKSLPLKPSDESKIVAGKMASPADTLLDEGITGSREGVFRQAKQQVGSIGDEISAQLKAAGGSPIDVSQHTAILKDLLEGNATYLPQESRAALQRALNGSVSPEDANTIRKVLGDVIPSSKFNANPSDTIRSNALKQIYGDLREKLGAGVPEIDPLLKKQQAFITTRNNQLNILGQERGKLPILGALAGGWGSRGLDLGLGGLAATEYARGDSKHGNEALSALALKHAITNPAVATRAAQGLYRLGKPFARMAGSKAQEPLRRMVNIAISKLSAPKPR